MLEFINRTTGRKALYKCHCGNITEAFIANVNREHTKSCGCMSSRINHSIKHGHSQKGNRSKAYTTWCSLKNRCDNENNRCYKNYGGRGITYCNEWKVFDNFLNDMGEPPEGMSIDRINNDLGYFKENCRWATTIEQASNTRTNCNITYNGKTQTVTAWSRELGIPRVTLQKRIASGSSIENAFSKDNFINKKDVVYTFNGKSQNITEWAKECHINRFTLYKRLRNGWQIERALCEKLHK